MSRHILGIISAPVIAWVGGRCAAAQSFPVAGMGID